MISFTRKELYDLVWSKPIKTIACELGLKPVHFANVCDQHDIPRPSPGYWQKLQFGKPVYKPELKNSVGSHIDLVSISALARNAMDAES